MNAIVQIINSAGRTFAQFALPMLIQSSVLIALLLLVDLALKRKVRAVFRYWIWLLVLVKLVLPPTLWSPVSFGTWFGRSLEVPATALQESIEPQREPVSLPTTLPRLLSMPPQRVLSPGLQDLAGESTSMPARAVAPIPLEPPEPSPVVEATPAEPAPSLSWQGLTLVVWAVVAFALLLLLIQRALFVKGLVAQADLSPRPLQEALDECRTRMGVRGTLAMRISANATSPAVCGLARPTILIPRNLVPRLKQRDLQAVLLHELAHIKRGDLWINLLQTLLQVVYFYNPLLWLANAMIRRVREKAVDEAVLVAMGEAAEQYPETLVNIAKMAFRRRPALSLRLIGVVESKSALRSRIKHMLTRPIPKTAKLSLLGIAVLFLTAAVLLPMAKARPLTDRARNVTVLAQEEARALNHSYIGTEHILLALARQEDAVSTKVLWSLGVGIAELRSDIAARVQPGPEPTVTLPLRLTPRAQQVLDDAEEEAKALGHSYIGTEHILLALTQEEQGLGAEVLNDLSLTRSQILSETLRFIRPGNASPADVMTESSDNWTEESQLALRRALMRDRMPLAMLTAHAYYEVGEPVWVYFQSAGGNWKSRLEEIEQASDTNEWIVVIDGIEYGCDMGLGPFGGTGAVLEFPDQLDIGTSDFRLSPGKHTVAYGWKSVDVVDPNDPDRTAHFDRLLTDPAEFEVVEQVPADYYRPVYEDRWEAVLRGGVETFFTDDAQKAGVAGTLLTLRVGTLPFDIAFDVYAQAEGSEQLHPAGQLAKLAGSIPNISGRDRNVPGLDWDTVGDRRWRLVFKPSTDVARSRPPIHEFYGREFVTDWVSFEPSPGFEQNRLDFKRGQSTPDASLGTVVDSQGSPIAGATLDFEAWDAVEKKPLSLGHVTTDSDGCFTIPPVDPGGKISLIIAAAGFYTCDYMDLGRRADGSYWPEGPTFTLQRTGTIEGTVLGPDGSPLAGAPLSLTTSGDLIGCVSNALRAITDESGHFRIDGVPPGTHVLYYPWSGPTTREVDSGKWQAFQQPGERYPSAPVKGVLGGATIELDEGGEVTDVLVDLSKSTCAVEGRVRDAAGRLVGGATVDFYWKLTNANLNAWGPFEGEGYSSAITDSDGRYRLANLPPGDWHVGISHQEGQSKADLLPVHLEPGRTVQQDLPLSGRVSQDTASRGNRVYLADCETPDADVVLDLATGQLLSAEPLNSDKGYFERLGKGDILYEHARKRSSLLCMRGTTLQRRTEAGIEPLAPDGSTDGFTGYYIDDVPAQYQVTTAEGDTYNLTVLSIDPGDRGGIRVEYARQEVLSPADEDAGGGVLVGSREEWGEAVDGIRCRLTPDKTVWTSGEVPTLKVEARNDGASNRMAFGDRPVIVEVDGEWFRDLSGGAGVEFPCGGVLSDLPIPLDRRWIHLDAETAQRFLQSRRTIGSELFVSASSPESLILRPGRHVIRVAMVTDSRTVRDEGVRPAVSNPVEVEVVSAGADDIAWAGDIRWGPEIGGLRLGVDVYLPQRPVEQGGTARCSVYIGNVGAEPATLVYTAGRQQEMLGSLPVIKGLDGFASPATPARPAPTGERKELTVTPGDVQFAGMMAFRIDPEAPPEGAASSQPHYWLQPGTYGVGCTYQFSDGPAATWHGELASGFLEFEVQPRRVALRDLETPDADVVLDLATGQLLSAEPVGSDPRYFQRLGKGDIAYEYAANKSGLLCLRGTTLQRRTEAGLEPLVPDIVRDGFSGYFIEEVPARYQVTTAEGDTYDLTVLSIDTGDRGYAWIEFSSHKASSPADEDAGGGVLVGSEQKWGEAVEGVRCRLTAEKTVWTSGEVPSFTVEARNDGTLRRYVISPVIGMVQIDEQWYRSLSGGAAVSLSPGGELKDLPIDLSGEWARIDTETAQQLLQRRRGRGGEFGFSELPAALVLPPGEHTVKLGLLTYPPTVQDGPSFGVVSNPVEIEVVSPIGDTELIEQQGTHRGLELRIVPRQSQLAPEILEACRDSVGVGSVAGGRYVWRPVRAGTNLPPDAVVQEHESQTWLLLCNDEPSIMVPGQGWSLTQVERTTDAYGRLTVSFRFDAVGAKRFSPLTEHHVGQSLAMVVDNTVLSAPRINERISDTGVITGAFTEQEVADLVVALGFPAPAPLPSSEEIQRRDISGQVVDPNGQLVAGAQVAACSAHNHVNVTDGRLVPDNIIDTAGDIVETNASGRFAFSDVPSESLVIACHETGIARIDSRDLTSNTAIVLKPWARIEGTLHIEGEPAEDREVAVSFGAQEHPFGFAWYRAQAETEANGEFSISKVVPDWLTITYMALADDSEDGVTNVRVIHAQPGETLRLALGDQGRSVVGRIALPPDDDRPSDAVYAGCVLETTGPDRHAPVDSERTTNSEKRQGDGADRINPYIESFYHNPDGQMVLFLPNEDGFFRITDVTPGKYRLLAHLRKPSPESTEVIGPYAATVEVPPMDSRRNEPLDIGVIAVAKERVAQGENSAVAEAGAAEGLEFLQGIPEFRDLRLEMTEADLRQYIHRHSLVGQRDGEDDSPSYHLFTEDGENVIVMFRDGRCSGIQRMRPDREEAAKLYEAMQPHDISGRVVDPNGQPVAGAQVALCSADKKVDVFAGKLEAPRLGSSEEAQVVETDAQGRFRFDSGPNDGFTLVVAHDLGFASVGSSDLSVSDEIRLTPWGRVVGQVAEGRYVLGSQIWISATPYSSWFDRGYEYRGETRHDSEKKFVFEKVPPGWCEVGYLTMVGDSTSSFTSRTPVEVGSGETATLTLGGEGRPVIGRFVPPAGHAEPIYFGEGLRSLATQWPDRPEPADYDQMTQRQQQQWYEQWRKTPEAKAWSGAVWHDPNRRQYAFHINTDGTFRIEDVIAGVYDMTVWLQTPPSSQSPPQEDLGSYNGTVEVPLIPGGRSDEPFDLGDLVLQMNEPALSVGDAAPLFTAKTLDGTDIHLADYRGKFVLLSFWMPVSHPELDRLKRFYETYSRSGRLQIIGFGGNDTLSEVENCVTEHEIEWPQVYFGQTWNEGVAKQFRLQGLPYILLVDPEGRIVATWLRSDKLTDTVETALSRQPQSESSSPDSEAPSQDISGQVVDSTGRPIADAIVTVENVDLLLLPEPMQSTDSSGKTETRPVMRGGGTRTDLAGRFTLADIGPGVTDLCVSVRSGAYRTEFIRDVATGTEDLRITLGTPRPYTLSGVVVDERGMGLDDVRVVLLEWRPSSTGQDEEARLLTARTNTSGVFAFDETLAPANRGQLRRVAIARKAGYGFDGKPIDLTGGQTSVRLTLRPEEKVSGTVRDAAGEPIAGARVVLRGCIWSLVRSLDIPMSWSHLLPQAVTAADGSFILKELPTETDLSFAVSATDYAPSGRQSAFTGRFGSYGFQSDDGYVATLGTRERDPNTPLVVVLQRAATNADVVAQPNNLLRQLVREAAPGSTVIVPPGTYDVTVEIDKPLVLRGESAETCIIEVTANQPALAVDTQTQGNVTLENLTIKWQLATSDETARPYALAVRDSNVSIRKCRFVPLGNNQRCPVAVRIDGFSRATVDECTFSGFEYTVCYGPGSEGLVRNCVLVNPGHQGITGYENSILTVERTIVIGSGYHGLRCTGGVLNASGNILTDNRVSAIYLGNKNGRGVIANNVMLRNATAVAGFYQSEFVVENNVIFDSTAAGVGMWSTCRLDIRNNVFQDNAAALVVYPRDSMDTNAIGRNLFWQNDANAKDCEIASDSLLTDPLLSDPNAGDFSAQGLAREENQGLSDPFIISALWLRYEQAQRQREALPTPRVDAASRTARRVATSAATGVNPIGRHALSFDGIDDCLIVPPDQLLRFEPPFFIEIWAQADVPQPLRPVTRLNSDYWSSVMGFIRLGAEFRDRPQSQSFFDDETVPEGIDTEKWPAVWPSTEPLPFIGLQADGFMGWLRKASGSLMQVGPDGDIRQANIFRANQLMVDRPGWQHFYTWCYDANDYLPSDGPLVIGDSIIPGSVPFKGRIAEVRLWNGLLPATGSQPRGSTTVTGSEPNLIACWTFDEGEGQAVHDIGPHRLHAHLGKTGDVEDSDPTWVDSDPMAGLPFDPLVWQSGSIQALIDDALPGDVIQLPAGVFEEQLVIDKPLTLVGAGWEQTTILTRIDVPALMAEIRAMQQRAGETANESAPSRVAQEVLQSRLRPVVHVTGAAGVVIRGVKLSCLGANTEGNSLALPVLRFDDAVGQVSDCAIVGSLGDGIHIGQRSNVGIENTLVAAAWGTGVVVDGLVDSPSHLRLLDCDVRNCYYAGVRIRAGNDARIERCRISGAAWHGIRYDDASPEISHNLIFGNARSGIYASGQTDATVMNNLFYANEMCGQSCWFQNSDFIGNNTFVQNGRSGLEILGASQPTVRRNLFYANPIAIQGGSIRSDDAHANAGDAIVPQECLLWMNGHDMRWWHDPNMAEDAPSTQLANAQRFDPQFVSAAAKDFSLQEDSPARAARIGVADPMTPEGPWPRQPEEIAIIPEGDTRDYRQWKRP